MYTFSGQLDVWTGRVNDWRHYQNTDILFFDCTLKTGDIRFAPTGELLWPYKRGEYTDEEYTAIYYQITRERFRDDPEPWLWLIRQERICLACYCRPGKFCHRHLLVDILEKLCQREGIRLIRRGELIW